LLVNRFRQDDLPAGREEIQEFRQREPGGLDTGGRVAGRKVREGKVFRRAFVFKLSA
jgi:hypothetical protein